jgi:hypothetical protein
MTRVKNKIVIIATLLLLMNMIPSAYAWSNGGWSIDINNPKNGTHDQILEKAINMLPSEMKSKINIIAAKYGSEIPDCKIGPYCIGDSTKHHVYYRSNGNLQNGTGAKRAQEEYDLAKSSFQNNDSYNFSLHIGAMSHYMSDLAVFGHTMGSNTDWGAEKNHSVYESYVNSHPELVGSVVFDNKLDNISAYNASLAIAKDTTFDNGIYTNVWMDQNYNWSNPNYVKRTESSISYATNSITDVIYTLLKTGNSTPIPNNDIVAYYRSLGQYPSTVETNDLLKAADDWRDNIVQPGFSASIATSQLLTLADEWRNS